MPRRGQRNLFDWFQAGLAKRHAGLSCVGSFWPLVTTGYLFAADSCAFLDTWHDAERNAMHG